MLLEIFDPDISQSDKTMQALNHGERAMTSFVWISDYVCYAETALKLYT